MLLRDRESVDAPLGYAWPERQLAAFMSATFDSSAHAYRSASGQPVASVTDLLKAHGLIPPWPPGIDPLVERKRKIGADVHEATTRIDRGEKYLVTEETAGYIDAYIAFRKACGFVPGTIEQPYVGRLNGLEIGMRPDRVGSMQRGHPALGGQFTDPCVFDLKCAAQEQ